MKFIIILFNFVFFVGIYANTLKSVELMGYCGEGDFNKVKELIAEGADVNYRSERYGTTPLINAVKYENKEIVSFLLENGANADIKDFEGNNLLSIALNSSDEYDIIKIILKKEIEINTLNNENKSVFYYADFYKNEIVLDMIYEKYEEQCLKKNINPFKEAIKNNDKVLFSKLISNLKKLDFIDEEGDTPLIYFVKSGDILSFKELLKRGANINYADKNGNTPLFYAVLNEKSEMVKYILENKGEINIKNKDGKSSIHYAIDKENKEILKILLNYSAKVDKNIIKKAEESENNEIFEILTMYN